MAPVERLLPEHLQPCDDQPEEHRIMMAALSELPDETQQRILAEIVITARRCEATQDYRPLNHLTTSLYATALLRRKPDYLAALAEADAAEAAGPPADAIDMDALMSRVRAGR